jgi:hypothetical protein
MSNLPSSSRWVLTDSPWFWTLLFTLCGTFAVLAMGDKYGRRQSTIERKYQARQRLQQEKGLTTQAEGTSDGGSPQAFSQSDSTLIPLWPLAAITLSLSLFSGFMLVRQRMANKVADESDLR